MNKIKRTILAFGTSIVFISTIFSQNVFANTTSSGLNLEKSASQNYYETSIENKIQTPVPKEKQNKTVVTTHVQPDLSSISYLKKSNEYTSVTVEGMDSPVYSFSNRGESLPITDPNFNEYKLALSKLNFTEFEFKGGSVHIDIKCSFTVTSYKILPSDFSINGTIEGNSLSITLDKPKKFMVEFNGQKDNAIMIFADAPMENAPNKGSKVLYYSAGSVYNIGSNYTVPSNINTIYIEAGAVVVGSFAADVFKRKNLKICGHGILYNGDVGWQNGVNAIRVSQIDSFTLQDIMVIGSCYHTIKVNEVPNTHISNIKIIGPFWVNSDGINLGYSPGSTIDNCFIYTQDDSMVLYGGEKATNNVVANTQNGSAVLANIWATVPCSDIVVDGLYIMHGQHCGTQSAIEILQYNQEPTNNIVFKNIYAEDINSGAFIRIMQEKRYCDSSITIGYTPGKMSDIYFKNVYLHDNYGGIIHGFDADHNISNIYFNNFNIWDGSAWSVKSSIAEIGVTKNANVSGIYFNTPAVFIEGNENDYIVAGESKKITVDCHYIKQSGKVLKSVELWMDGSKYDSLPAVIGKGSYTLKLDHLTEGSHDLHAVAVTTDSTTYQSRSYTLEAKQADQILFNKDFEYGKNGLNDNNGDYDWFKTKNSTTSLSTVTSGAHSGLKALEVTGRTNTKDGIYQSINDQLHQWYKKNNPADGIYPITFSAWVKNGSVASNMRFAIKYYDWSDTIDDPQYYMCSEYSSVGTEWTKITMTWNIVINKEVFSTACPTEVDFAFENDNATEDYFIDDCTASISSNPVSSTKYEAETANITGGIVTSNVNTGYSGTGYVEGYEQTTGASIKFTVDVAQKGYYSTSIGYANGTSSTQNLSVYVNGKYYTKAVFESNNDWTSWVKLELKLPLITGSNTIALMQDSNNSGAPKLDYISIPAAPYAPIIEKDSKDTTIPPSQDMPMLSATAVYGTPQMNLNQIDPLWNNVPDIKTERWKTVYTTTSGAIGVFKVMWDDNNLYILTKVSDDLLNKESSDSWQQDSTEVFVDEKNSKAINYTDASGGIYQLRVNYDNTNVATTTGYDKSKLTTLTKVVDGGYLVEYKIPFMKLTPYVGAIIGFDAQVNDASSNGLRTSISSWNDVTDLAGHNASKLGEVMLVKEGLKNPGFESADMTGWTNGSDYTVEVGTTYAHSGSYGCLVKGRINSWSSPQQDVTNVISTYGDGKYNIVGYIKLPENAIKSETGYLTLGIFDDPSHNDVDHNWGRQYIRIPIDKDVTVTKDGWTRIAGTVDIKIRDILQSALLKYASTSGTTSDYIMDDFSFSRVETGPGSVIIPPEAGDELLTNGGFETGDSTGYAHGSNDTSIFAVNAAYANSGNYGCLVTSRVNKSDGPHFNFTNNMITYGSGKYNIEGYVKLADTALGDTDTAYISLAIQDGPNIAPDWGYQYISIPVSQAATVTKDGWTKISGTADITLRGTVTKTQMVVSTSKPYDIMVDDLSIKKASN